MQKLLPRIELLLQSLVTAQSTCPHCGSIDLSTVTTKYRLVKIQHCHHCHLFFTSPIYQSWLSDGFYDRLYKAEGSTTEMPNPEQLSELLKQKFQNSDKYFGDRLQVIAELTENRNLLEIGSSWGYFLWQAQAWGFQATGIELSDVRREFGRQNLGARVFKHIHELGEEKFEVIYTAHTLEHFIDLSHIFKELAKHLNLGGQLLIEVPNFDFFAKGKSCLSIIGAVHPIGFCSDFFRLNLPKYGFEIVGFYNNWQEFPTLPVEASQDDIILLLAKKVADAG